MRRFLIIITLLVANSNLWAQNDSILPNVLGIYHITEVWGGDWPNLDAYQHILKLINPEPAEDTLLVVDGNDTIAEIALDGYQAYIRQYDPENYEEYSYFDLDISEEFQLLYDFSLETDDVFIGIMEYPSQVIGTGTVYINGYPRKTLSLEMFFGFDYWIQGLGSTANPLAPRREYFESYSYVTHAELYYSGESPIDTVYFPDNVVGISKINHSSIPVQLYPNPCSKNLTISTPDNAILKIDIQKTSGLLIKSYPVDHSQETQLDISHLPKGFYFATITTDSGIAVRKFLKM